MKWRKLFLATTIASCCYLPCMAGSLDEALAVSSDKHVAYTFYLGMDCSEAQDTMDALSDWEKSKSYDSLNTGLIYNRTLADGTVEEIWLDTRGNRGLHDYQITFKTKTVGEAVRMFYKVRSQLKEKYGAPLHHSQDVNSEVIDYGLDHNDDVLSISYNKKEQLFSVRRIEVDMSVVKDWAVKKYGKCKN